MLHFSIAKGGTKKPASPTSSKALLVKYSFIYLITMKKWASKKPQDDTKTSDKIILVKRGNGKLVPGNYKYLV